MRRKLSRAVLLIALIPLASCTESTSSKPEGVHSDWTPSEPEGVRVEAREEVMLSDTPLGDVLIGRLSQGDTATAVCFVGRAQTNAGFSGSAIKITTGDLTGYAAVSDFPRDPADRQAIFDLDAETLRNRLPACAA